MKQKLIFFLVILTFIMATLDAQQNFMLTKCMLSFLFLLDQKLYFFCEKNVKVEHTICDCISLSQEIQIN